MRAFGLGLVLWLFMSPALAAPSASSSPNIQIANPGTSQSDLCVGEGSLASATSVFAFTFDMPRAETNCVHMRIFEKALQLNRPEVATQIMCDLPIFYRAMARAGTPCEEVYVRSPPLP